MLVDRNNDVFLRHSVRQVRTRQLTPATLVRPVHANLLAPVIFGLFFSVHIGLAAEFQGLGDLPGGEVSEPRQRRVRRRFLRGRRKRFCDGRSV